MKRKILLFCAVGVLILVVFLVMYCGQRPALFTTTSTPPPLSKPDVTFQPRETIIAIEENPTYITLYEGLEQITDGRLSLTIQEIDVECHEIGAPIKIRLVFYNQTNDLITINSDLHLSSGRFREGNITPLLYSIEQSPLYTSGDFSNPSDTFWAPTPTFTEIPARSSYERIVDYYFPLNILDESSQSELSFVTPLPGEYYIRFLYQSIISSMENVWIGSIASNPIKICIIRN